MVDSEDSRDSHDFDDLDAWLRLTRRLHAVDGQLDDSLRRRNDLCVTWFEVMAELATDPGPMRVAALADRVTISQPRVSRVLGLMEERSLVNRGAVAEDARGTEVELTAAGLSLFQEATVTYREVLEAALLNQLTVVEIGVLRSLAAKLGGANHDAPLTTGPADGPTTASPPPVARRGKAAAPRRRSGLPA